MVSERHVRATATWLHKNREKGIFKRSNKGFFLEQIRMRVEDLENLGEYPDGSAMCDTGRRNRMYEWLAKEMFGVVRAFPQQYFVSLGS